MKKIFTVLFAITSGILVSGCSLTKETSIDTSIFTEQISLLQEQLSWANAQIQLLTTKNEELTKENDATKATLTNCITEWNIVGSKDNQQSCCVWLKELEYIWGSKICYDPKKWVPICVQAGLWNYKHYVYPNSEPYSGEIVNPIDDLTDNSYYECRN